MADQLISPPEMRRVEQTVAVRDTDRIPKVADAGNVADGVQTMHNGVRVVEGCYYGAWMTEIIRRLDGHHEPQEEVVFHELVERLVQDRADPVVLEVGAFWSYYSLWVLQRAPAARTFMVEPDPAHLEAGRANFAINGREGVFVNAAVGATAMPPAPFPCESDGAVRDIPTESLPSLLERFELDAVDLVLVDVQGAELAFLEGALELIAAGRVRFVLVSTHHHSISGDALTHQRCLDVLRRAGGHIISEHTVAESCSGDGLIAVSFDPRDRDLTVSVSRVRPEDSLFGDPLHDLDRALRREADVRQQLLHVSEVQQELADLYAERAELTQRVADLEGRLDSLLATRTFRWSTGARAVYSRLRNR